MLFVIFSVEVYVGLVVLKKLESMIPISDLSVVLGVNELCKSLNAVDCNVDDISLPRSLKAI